MPRGVCGKCGMWANFGRCSHCRATLDADGEPLRKGDTFYVIANGRQGTVEGIGSPGLLTVSWDDEHGKAGAALDAIYSQYVLSGQSPIRPVVKATKPACPNCDQWQYPTSAGYYDCCHECTRRGFAPKKPTSAPAVPAICPRCGATSAGGIYCPNGCGKIGATRRARRRDFRRGRHRKRRSGA